MKNQEKHFINRSGWLRAGVLGANDGILSTASIIIGVAAASTTREPVLLAGIAGLVAGALSMAAGEYVSVSSQTDIEKSDLAREKQELIDTPEEELIELAKIYKERGLTAETALEVAKQLTARNALEAHARDELGIHEMTEAKPLQAALSSGVAFTVGGFLPVLVSIVAPIDSMEYIQYAFAILFLTILGILSARTGGAKPLKPILRITFWGTLAMGLTAFIGYLFNVNIA
jgi:VIT1/CCC1 family predicted Fe2+/Mn2+ transporter